MNLKSKSKKSSRQRKRQTRLLSSLPSLARSRHPESSRGRRRQATSAFRSLRTQTADFRNASTLWNEELSNLPQKQSVNQPHRNRQRRKKPSQNSPTTIRRPGSRS